MTGSVGAPPCVAASRRRSLGLSWNDEFCRDPALRRRYRYRPSDLRQFRRVSLDLADRLGDLLHVATRAQ
jgi:hypothetical protein